MVDTVSKAFLSYVHEDMEVAERIQRHLQRNGIGVWRDKDELPGGSRWKTRIRDAIRSGTYFLSLHSEDRTKKRKSFAHDELAVAIEELRLRPTSDIWLIPIRIDDCTIDDRPLGGGEFYSDLHVEDLRDFEPGIIRLLGNLGVVSPVLAEEKKKIGKRGEFTAPQGSPFAAIKALEELNKLPDETEVPIDALATAFGGRTIRDLTSLKLIKSERKGYWRLSDSIEDAKLALAMAIVNIPAFQVVVGELKKDINSNGTDIGRRVADFLGRDWTISSCRRNGQAYKKWVVNLYPNFKLPEDGDESFLRARAISTQSPKQGPAAYITSDVLIKISQFKSEGLTIAEMGRKLHISGNTIRSWKLKNKSKWDKL